MRHRRVQCNHGTGTVGFRTYGTEFKAIACKGERRGAVAVSVINQQFGNLRDIQLHSLFASQRNKVIICTFFHVIQHLCQLFAQKRRDDGGRCLVGSQTMCIGGTHDGGLQQSVMVVNCHQGIDDKSNETQVVFGCLSGSHQQDTGICT